MLYYHGIVDRVNRKSTRTKVAIDFFLITHIVISVSHAFTTGFTIHINRLITMWTLFPHSSLLANYCCG